MCKEISEFHGRFRPFVDRIYRGALIITSNPKQAEQLQAQIYLEAFLSYLETRDIIMFQEWLIPIVRDCFLNYTKGITDQKTLRSRLCKKAIRAVAGV